MACGLAGMQRRDAIDHVKPVNVLLFILICLFFQTLIVTLLFIRWLKDFMMGALKSL